jgi:hypothetical protein
MHNSVPTRQKNAVRFYPCGHKSPGLKLIDDQKARSSAFWAPYLASKAVLSPVAQLGQSLQKRDGRQVRFSP